MCTRGHTTYDSIFHKHSIDYFSKFHASYLEKKPMQRSVLSRFEPTAVNFSISRLGPAAFILDGSFLVFFLFALFEELVWNERCKKSNAWCLIAQLIQNKVKKQRLVFDRTTYPEQSRKSNTWCLIAQLVRKGRYEQKMQLNPLGKY